MARLLILRGEISDREVELKGKTVRLGRGPQNDVRLEDAGKSVSRNHAEIRYEGGRYVLVDLESQNGVWVAGKKVPRVVLEPDVVASVGPYRLMVHSGSGTLAYRPEAVTYTGPGPGLVPDSGQFESHDAARKKDPVPAARQTASSAGLQQQFSDWSNRQPKWLLPAAGAAVVGIVAIAIFALMRGSSPPVEDEMAALMEAHLTAANSMIQAGECARALSEHIEPALVNDPGNVRAQTLRTTAEGCVQVPPPPPPPPPPTRLTPEEITLHLGEAGKLVDAGNCPAAIAEHINPVLADDPANAEALKLRTRAEVCQPSPPPPPPPPGGGTAVRIPPEKGGLEPLPREPQKDYELRVKVMRERYDEAAAALSSGAYQRADELFGGIVRDVMTDRYLDAGRLWIQAKGGVKQVALKIYQAAHELEKKDEWDKAIQEFRRAQETDPANFVVDGDLKRVTDKKTALGLKRCEEGRTNFSYPNRNAEALAAYEDAVRLLPQGHPCFAEAKKNLTILRANK